MKQLVILALGLMLLTFGCVSTATPAESGDAMMKDGETMVKDDVMVEKDGDAMEKEGDSMMEEDDAMMEAGFVEYVPFTQAAYDQAKAEGKTIFLEFYASWCPTCKAQAPALESGLAMIKSDNLVAFRVNYNDTETDADEQALAKKFNITYQHTHVVTNANEETLLKSQETWSEQDVVSKVGAFA